MSNQTLFQNLDACSESECEVSPNPGIAVFGILERKNMIAASRDI